MKVLALAVALGVVLPAQLVWAQAGAGAKARGEFNFYGSGARSAMRGARESAQSFRYYLRYAQAVQSPVVREVPQQVVAVSPRIAQAASDEDGGLHLQI
jgi:hypothetical protein